MGNIMISVKRFFQNKNTVTIFAILIAVGIIYFAYNFRIKKSTEPVNVPYATQEIGPRTQITEDMVSTRSVPGGVVTKDVITDVDSIVNKFVINTGVIPEGSLFYESMLISEEDFVPSVSSDIPDGFMLYALNVNQESTFGNSIFPGNYIDIYYSTQAEDGKAWIGKFIESIQVLDVEDSAGNSVFETIGDPLQPEKLIFAIDEDMFSLFSTIENVGNIELFPVQRNSNYSKQATPAKIVGTEFRRYVESQAIKKEIIKGGN